MFYTKRLRKFMTTEEKILWQSLKDRRCAGWKFRRQVNIGPYIVDFLCKEFKAIVEIDGLIHLQKKQKEHDIVRDQYLREHGFHILRIKNDDVHFCFPAVLALIRNFIESLEKKKHKHKKLPSLA
ncbi:hypothetical protein COU76_00365 [Candidatus Peregrinibacteria bacterium CG10_big_fil_rev_8_21_14_0_10_49_10]|nr:MAG: hypothetical protein COU76_00365 [Candidatus Peregrinibacteria bacterium CG10_big_fil_rev_8_21_14_0_10_49_10]